MDVVSEFDDFDYVGAVIGVLHFAVFALAFRLLLFGAPLHLAVQAEVLLDVEQHLLELAQLDIGLAELGLERLHVVVDLLRVLALLAFVLLQSKSFALLWGFSCRLLLSSVNSLTLRESRCWIPDGHITTEILACCRLLLLPLKFNLHNFS